MRALAMVVSLVAIGAARPTIAHGDRVVVIVRPARIDGAAAPSAVRDRVRAHDDRLAACYHASKRRPPRRPVTIQARFAIDRAGRVGTTRLRGAAEALTTCVALQLRTVRFDADAPGAVTIDLVFRRRPPPPVWNGKEIWVSDEEAAWLRSGLTSE